MDRNEMCRTCLRSGEPMCSLFDLKGSKMDPSQVDLFEMLGIRVYHDDGLPHQICTDCVEDIQRSYAFKLKFKRSQLILKQLKDVKIRLKKSNDGEMKRENLIENYEIANLSLQNWLQLTKNSTEKHEINTNIKTEQSSNVLPPTDAKLEHDNNGNHFSDRNYSVLQYVKQEPELDISLLDGKTETISSDREHHTEFSEYSVIRTKRKRLNYSTNSMKKDSLVCRICRKNYRRRDNLIRHLNSHSKYHEIDVDYKCMECFRIFSCNADLIRHERSHTKETPFQCEICSKTFRYQNNLKAHVQALHYVASRSKDSSKKHTFQCDACCKTFKYKRCLQKHKKIKHDTTRNADCALKLKRRNKQNKQFLKGN